jgi:hypothetical protein
MIEHLLDSVEIEVIADIFFVYFTEKLMIFQIAKPVDPANTFLRAI